jgi:C4-type Zn-finger protein
METPKKPSDGPRRAFGELYDETVACPWCESEDTEVISPFGGTVSEVSMRCRSCKSTFGWMKWQGKLPPG